MGGDGGVVAVKREYMRGAGTANQTGDYGRADGGDSRKHLSDREDALQRMTTCALTKLPLFAADGTTDPTATIVACPLGRLYQKEAAVEALLRRKQRSLDHANNATNDTHEQEDELGSHIRGLKDLFPVRFHMPNEGGSSAAAKLPTCPVTGQELNGQLPVILLVPGNPELPNVVSQRAFKEMGKETLETEYGPIREEIRLAPPTSEVEKIRLDLETKRANKKEKSLSGKKKHKKRKETNQLVVASTDINDHNNSNVQEAKKQRITGTGGGVSGAAQVARGRVHDAIRANDNLSSLFVKDKKSSSNKEHAADLFART